MALANVALTDTFDQWRIKTNALIDAYGQNLAFLTSNSSALYVTPRFQAGDNVFFQLTLSNNATDTSSANIPSSRAVSNTWNVAVSAHLKANNALPNTGNATFINVLTANGYIAPYFRTKDDANTYLRDGVISLRGTTPTLYLRDENDKSAAIYVNSNTFYIIGSNSDNSTFLTLPNGQYPLSMNIVSGNTAFGGSVITYDDFSSVGQITANQGGVFLSNTRVQMAGANNKGLLFLGNTSTRYLSYDGSRYDLAGANLYVNGVVAWTSLTDGVGSGLDADLLDGQDSTYYATNSSLNTLNTFAYGVDANQKAGNSFLASVNTFAYGVDANQKAGNSFLASVNTFAYVVDSNVKTLNTFAYGVGTNANAAFAKANDAYSLALISSGNTINAFNDVANNIANVNAFAYGVRTNSYIIFDKANNALPNTGNALFNGSLTVNGSLIITGNTTSVTAQQLVVDDPTFILNGDLSGSTPPTQDSGLIVNRGIENDVTLLWDETNDAWTYSVPAGTRFRIASNTQIEAGNTFASYAANSSNAWTNSRFTISSSISANVAVGANTWANTFANTKLANTSGMSFAGDLFFPTGNIAIGTSTAKTELTVESGQILLDALLFNANTKHNSQGIQWDHSTFNNVPSIILNGQSDKRPEISFIRGTRTFPEFSIRQHTNNDAGVELYAGTGSTAPFKMYEIVSNTHNWFTRNTNRLTITDTGSVGVGNTSPQAPLHIGSLAGFGTTELRISSPGSNGAAVVRFTNLSGTQLGYVGYGQSTANGIFLYNYAEDGLYLGTNNTTRMTVGAYGNVGIGQSDGLYRLTLNSPRSGLLISTQSATSNYPSINFIDGSMNGVVTSSTSANGVFVGSFSSNSLHLITGNSTRATILPSGNFGIGNTNPQHRLSVAGSIYSDSTITAANIQSNTATFSGAVSTGTLTLNGNLVGGGYDIGCNDLTATGGVSGLTGTFSGDLAVNGGDITTTTTTASLFNATATTLNIGGAATTINYGSTSGSSIFKHAVNVNVSAGTNALFVSNSDAATSVATIKDSPFLLLRGAYWNGTASTNYDCQLNFDITAASPAAGQFTVDIGGAQKFSVDNSGTVTATTFSGNVAWTNITSKPTTLSGYGITDAALSARSLTISNGTGITGGAAYNLTQDRSWTIALTGQALALHNLATDGIIVRTGSGTVAGRTISAGTGVTVTNGDGVLGNPSIAIGQAVSTSSSVTFAGITVTGDVALNGGDITTTATTASVFNATATTLNIGQAATTVSIGATSGTTTVRNALSVSGGGTITGDLAVNGGDITTSTTTASIFNATATTLNIGQAATTVSIGATSGTTTVRNALSVSGAISGSSTITSAGDLATNGGDITTTATTASVFNATATTLNIGGAATALNLGATTGTTTIKNSTRVTALAVGASNPTMGSAGTIRANGDITAYATSDRTLKENITPITNAIVKINTLEGVEFDWSNKYIEREGGEDGYFIRRHDVGVIAQDVVKVLPEAVATREDGTLAVRYEKIIPLLVQAVNELSEEVKQLKKKLGE